MVAVKRYYWEPNDLEEFLSLYREIYDQHLCKAGASDMTLWQDCSNWKLYVAEVRFENFAALDNWEAYFKTEEGKDIGA